MNPVVALALREVESYVVNHPEVMQQLVEQAVQGILGWIKAQNAPKP